MQIAIIGSGRMGVALAELFAKHGHNVRVGSRDPQKAAEALQSIEGALALPHEEALQDADLVYLAVPYRTGEYPPAHLRPLLAGRVMVEMANPLDWAKGMARLIPLDTSTGEELAAAAPGARVVSALKTATPGLLTSGKPFDVLLSSDDQEAKDLVARSLEGTPLRGLDAGPLATARVQEQLVPLLVQIGRKHKVGALRFE